MALEPVLFSQLQDHPYNNSCRDQFHFSNSGLHLDLDLDQSLFSYDFPNVVDTQLLWINQQQQQQQQYADSGYSSLGEAEPPSLPERGGGRRKRRRRSCKNKEEVEQQRMTHIAVERNRRKQMNHYLAVIRSLMPSSYAQRGDQASIVGGAINYVKELEQVLHSLEAPKNHHNLRQEPPESGISMNEFTGISTTTEYTNGSTQQKGVEVRMVERHANVKILAKKRPKQLLRFVTAFQGLRLSVLHLNVTSVDLSFLLYSFSLKVEEGCQLNSVDDITAATNHIIEEEEKQGDV